MTKIIKTLSSNKFIISAGVGINKVFGLFLIAISRNSSSLKTLFMVPAVDTNITEVFPPSIQFMAYTIGFGYGAFRGKQIFKSALPQLTQQYGLPLQSYLLTGQKFVNLEQQFINRAGQFCKNAGYVGSAAIGGSFGVAASDWVLGGYNNAASSFKKINN